MAAEGLKPESIHVDSESEQTIEAQVLWKITQGQIICNCGESAGVIAPWRSSRIAMQICKRP